MRKYTKVAAMATTMLSLCAMTMSATSISKQEINEGWTFKQVRGTNWYPATVPGTVHTDLMANNIIEDPYYRLNERAVQWVDKEDWEYKTIFTIAADLYNKENIELDFKGLDTYADVYLNDSCILKANNMFREWTVDIKGISKAGDNELRIYFHSPIKIDLPKYDARPYDIESGNDQSQNGGILDKKIGVFARKAGYHYGWDWGPRLVTSGVWKPIILQGWDDARIESIHYIQQEVTAKKAVINAVVEVIADQAGEVSLNIATDGNGNSWSTTTELVKGTNIIEKQFTIKKPTLWWSNGLGEAHLYPFTATLAQGDEVLDTQSDRLGIRSLKVINKPDEHGHTFYFELNGVPVFAKGANYIPQDNFVTRVTHEDNLRTVKAAVDANMNMLRIWGGGIYEYDEFYDLCDENGILIWQDFMFACATYPMTPEMLDNIRHEAIDQVKRLRNHASLAIWCGNNEMHAGWFQWGWMDRYEAKGTLEQMRKDYKDLFHGVLAEVTATYDPSVLYWPSSPYAGEPDDVCEFKQSNNRNPHGDIHYWGVWHGKDSIRNYNRIRARFFSEYGFQSFPEYQSVLRYAPEERDHSIYSDVMMSHQRGGTHANGLIEWYLLNEYRKPADFPNELYMGQLLQGDAIKVAMEAHRRDMPYCMGSLVWQHNDCWPVASWSSRDYFGRWKAQHYFTKKSYADILVSPIKEDDELKVYVISDRLTATRGTLEVRVMDLYGNVVYEYKKRITVSANTSKVQFTTDLEKALKGKAANEVVVNARFTEQRTDLVYDNNYYLARFKEISFPTADISFESVAIEDGIEVTLRSNVVTRGLFLSLEGIDNFFSDNYFDLLPGEPVTIFVRTSLNKAAFDAQLKMENY